MLCEVYGELQDSGSRSFASKMMFALDNSGQD